MPIGEQQLSPSQPSHNREYLRSRKKMENIKKASPYITICSTSTIGMYVYSLCPTKTVRLENFRHSTSGVT